ncbi:hypothetical protein Cgig2_028716 [Carnegiea gigantea]|uniref:Uncharacterized protein n=1 Tax=Carnegiea gigantea TaxID=171969 RepID=A0A9Q1KC97_9CARY|nr:hypothetical protein Cgig2_028716 [Carnegiea gigantea]
MKGSMERHQNPSLKSWARNMVNGMKDLHFVASERCLECPVTDWPVGVRDFVCAPNCEVSIHPEISVSNRAPDYAIIWFELLEYAEVSSLLILSYLLFLMRGVVFSSLSIVLNALTYSATPCSSCSQSVSPAFLHVATCLRILIMLNSKLVSLKRHGKEKLYLDSPKRSSQNHESHSPSP